MDKICHLENKHTVHKVKLTNKMKLTDIIKKYGSLYEIKAKDKNGFFAEISKTLAYKSDSLDWKEVEKILRERERIDSTALAPGVALPHGKSAHLEKPICCFARSREGIDFGAADGRPTHIFFTMLTPLTNNGNYLPTLAEVSMILSNPDLRRSLLQADNKEDVLDTIKNSRAQKKEPELKQVLPVRKKWGDR